MSQLLHCILIRSRTCSHIRLVVIGGVTIDFWFYQNDNKIRERKTETLAGEVSSCPCKPFKRWWQQILCWLWRKRFLSDHIDHLSDLIVYFLFKETFMWLCCRSWHHLAVLHRCFWISYQVLFLIEGKSIVLLDLYNTLHVTVTLS